MRLPTYPLKWYHSLFYWRCVREARGTLIPHWWLGEAYHDYPTDSTIYLIMPVNLLVAAWRWLNWRIRFVWPEALAEPYKRIYRLGQEDGFKMGRTNRDVVRGAMDILRGEGYDVTSRNDPGV